MAPTTAQQTKQTMEQKRAADAWARCQGCSNEYQNLAKSVPALIMNSGLMQVLAFLHEKGGKDHEVPAHHAVVEYLDAYILVARIAENWTLPSSALRWESPAK